MDLSALICENLRPIKETFVSFVRFSQFVAFVIKKA